MEQELLRAREERKHAREERDALRAVMKGEASAEALDHIEKASTAKPMRLMSGEEYRNWVQESVSRRLTGLISAIGVGGLIGLGSLGTLYVKSAVEANVTKQADLIQQRIDSQILGLKAQMETTISVTVKSAILDETGLTKTLAE